MNLLLKTVSVFPGCAANVVCGDMKQTAAITVKSMILLAILPHLGSDFNKSRHTDAQMKPLPGGTQVVFHGPMSSSIVQYSSKKQ
jgi:hypothetical protein